MQETGSKISRQFKASEMTDWARAGAYNPIYDLNTAMI